MCKLYWDGRVITIKEFLGEQLVGASVVVKVGSVWYRATWSDARLAHQLVPINSDRDPEVSHAIKTGCYHAFKTYKDGFELV